MAQKTGPKILVVVSGLSDRDELAQLCRDLSFPMAYVDPPKTAWPEHPGKKLVPDCMNADFVEFQGQLLNCTMMKIGRVLQTKNCGNIIVTTACPQSSRYPFLEYKMDERKLSKADRDKWLDEIQPFYAEWDAFVAENFKMVLHIVSTFKRDMSKAIAQQVAKGSPKMKPEQEEFYRAMYRTKFLELVNDPNTPGSDAVFHLKNSLMSIEDCLASIVHYA